MGNFALKLENFVSSVAPFVYAIVAFALLVLGIMMIYPSESSKEKAKNAVPWVVIGSAVAMGAVTIAKAITSGF
ncbi:MAG: hypothetical protein HXL15_02790 [Parvimonas sp.]|jgi:trbC/VIRB2 family|nr:hypothetical protein [Parvimonas sp.]MBF1275454.1 hypothetical protein [Parvimonas micra]